MTTPLLEGLPLVAAHGARVLILGSFPSAHSLAMRQYYANPRNAFWRITAELFGFVPDAPYENRLAALQSRGVALWDVLRRCRRSGSSDAKIEPNSMVVNDFAQLFANYPTISRVYFNGEKATTVFGRLVRIDASVSYHRLPSTSPANAISLDRKLAAWQVISLS
ncbi:MAG TPA: DNA-deoxyinosine glycosylase [Mycobacterium sp.]|uniref:DNA-deoxyinosine glycosylase n=1 Tax=Mycobacterium sp. TaxID=1785 RepID=UPI002D6A5998|nr:DNA-deoxyinosine glycosylase [Mycobacterium sp.]HZU47920.1 DNA-deoxyinosine glycosylase [Mycobacterium sp.]